MHLLPHSVLPLWARGIQAQCSANTYSLHQYSSTGWPSSRMLYHSILSGPSYRRSILKEITEAIGRLDHTQNRDQYVWGCKWHKGVMRWELYMYAFDFQQNPRSNLTLLPPSLPLPTVSPFIVSIDLFDRPSPLGPVANYYYTSQKEIRLPFEGYLLSDEGDHLAFIIDSTTRFKANFDAYMDRIQFPDGKKFRHRLARYSCRELCIFRKQDQQCLIMYLGISFQDFIGFLQYFQYPLDFIQHVMDHQSEYQDLIHEIAIVYDDQDREVRSAFYGIL